MMQKILFYLFAKTMVWKFSIQKFKQARIWLPKNSFQLISILQGCCGSSFFWSSIQVITGQCFSHCWLHRSYKHNHNCPCTSWCQHSSSKARVSPIPSSCCFLSPWSSPLWSFAWERLGGWPWFSWRSSRWEHCGHGPH